MTADPAGTDLLWILGEEDGTTGDDLLALGIDARNNFPWDTHNTVQQSIDETETNGGVSFIAHPAFAYSTISGLESLSGLAPNTNVPNSYVYTAWDNYRQWWWGGGDDAHYDLLHGAGGYDNFMVAIQTANAGAVESEILGSLDTGDFYTRAQIDGPVISSFSLTGANICITMTDVASEYTFTWKGPSNFTMKTETVDTTSCFNASNPTRQSFPYVYASIARVSDGLIAATQPFFIVPSRDFSSSATSSGGTAANAVDNSLATSCDLGADTDGHAHHRHGRIQDVQRHPHLLGRHERQDQLSRG